MIVCGIEIKGREAILAVVEVDDIEAAPDHRVNDTRKITLEQDDESAHVKSFFSLAEGFVRDNHITHIAIKKRGKKGDYAGGPITFKIEGLFQLLDNCNVALLSAPTIAASKKKHAFEIPASLKKYQHEAFLTACAFISKR
ncbi:MULTISPECIES: DUF3010 family protein [unclassified Caballeronia]|uniref:DUF3010 family protein n=1 Tax=unclassified Caballeronia TaxID=2646786 RepID=UPI00202878EF|nr:MULTISPECIES: DUF3010 family protein [unclassified Caballeronia]MDR5766152.1 DUF3010 family protein [Caballeronia sp. LZ028]